MEERQGQRRGRNSHGDGIIQRGILGDHYLGMKNRAVDNVSASARTYSPRIKQGCAKREKPFGTPSKSLPSYHRSSHCSKIFFKHLSRWRLNTDEAITQYWKRVANKVGFRNRAVFTKMGVKGKIATLESAGICNGLSPNITCIREAAHFSAC